MPKCSVCGRQVMVGEKHYACHEEAHTRECREVIALCDRLIFKCRELMKRRVKHWNRDMGIEEGRRLFPDVNFDE